MASEKKPAEDPKSGDAAQGDDQAKGASSVPDPDVCRTFYRDFRDDDSLAAVA